MNRIYKILPRSEWEAAVEAGAFDGSPVDHRDGFIHFSTAAQLPETAARHFGGIAGLVVLEVDPRPLGDDLKWEVSRGGDRFPHLYRSLAISEVGWAHPFPIGSDGIHVCDFLDPPGE